jgi:hypothetical protein
MRDYLAVANLEDAGHGQVEGFSLPAEVVNTLGKHKVAGPVREAVAFDERYRAEMFGQGASREQSGDASTDDDRSPAPKGAARRFTMGI